MDIAAPEWRTSHWLNSRTPLSLPALRGRIVLLHAFQMLCPGCVSHALPQAASVHRTFPAGEVTVVGLHSVFEHHEAMTVTALKAFVHEYRITYPVAVDQPGDDGDPVPLTMRAYGLRGTPSLLLFDRRGALRWHEFGQVSDLALGLHLGLLLAEPADGEDVLPEPVAAASPAGGSTGTACDDEACERT